MQPQTAISATGLRLGPNSTASARTSSCNALYRAAVPALPTSATASDAGCRTFRRASLRALCPQLPLSTEGPPGTPTVGRMPVGTRLSLTGQPRQCPSQQYYSHLRRSLSPKPRSLVTSVVGDTEAGRMRLYRVEAQCDPGSPHGSAAETTSLHSAPPTKPSSGQTSTSLSRPISTYKTLAEMP